LRVQYRTGEGGKVGRVEGRSCIISAARETGAANEKFARKLLGGVRRKPRERRCVNPIERKYVLRINRKSRSACMLIITRKESEEKRKLNSLLLELKKKKKCKKRMG